MIKMKGAYFGLYLSFETLEITFIWSNNRQHTYQSLPINQSQSQATPTNIPPEIKNTNKFPSAFCSGAYNQFSSFIKTIITIFVFKKIKKNKIK